MIGGRIPEIHIGEVRALVSAPNLVQMLYDGTTPGTIVQRASVFESHLRRAGERPTEANGDAPAGAGELG